VFTKQTSATSSLSSAVGFRRAIAQEEGAVMKGGPQTALALGVGYVLGRRRKMRMTTVLAVAAATGGLGGLGGAALRRGLKMAGSSELLGRFTPQLGELADTVRDDLMDAGKAAATAAVTNRLESLTDSLHERADLVRDPGAAAGRAGRAVRDGQEEATQQVRRRGRPAAGDDGADMTGDEDGDEETGAEDGSDEPEADEEATASRRTRSPVTRSSRSSASRTARPGRSTATRSGRSAAAQSGRSAVTRSGRSAVTRSSRSSATRSER
jgi:hypothetical protein